MGKNCIKAHWFYMINVILIFLIISTFQVTAHGEILKGIHDTIGGPQSDGFLYLTKTVGKNPDVLSSDFGFSTHPNDDYRKRPQLLKKIISFSASKKNKILTLSYHQCRPDIQEPCTFSSGVSNVDFTQDQWKEILTWNSPLNTLWQKQIKNLATFLLTLQEKNIIVYLRPYHESNLPLFWWADIKNPEHSIKLWKMLHRHLTDDYKLKNLKWVWSLSYHPKHIENLKQFYPGDEYVDLLGFDIYPPKRGADPNVSHAWQLLEKINNKKPKVLSEVSRLPSKMELQKYPWYYIVVWGDVMLRKENSKEEIVNFFQK